MAITLERMKQGAQETQTVLAHIVRAARTFLILSAGVLAHGGTAIAAPEDISHGPIRVVHQGQGVFSVSWPADTAKSGSETSATRIDLHRIEHGYDPAIDRDVPIYTSVTLNDRAPRLVDSHGRDYGLITLYQIDPPLTDLPSREPGIDRGIDMRSPADIVKSSYSNYVSPVFTDDADRLPVPNHPIGHFLVKIEIGGYPTVLTGMTTIQRADQELVDLTLGRQLGIGGVLLTPQPGRLNSSEEAERELSLRQRRLRVIDGLYYKKQDFKNVGPEYIVEDGNVVFARFKVPPDNVKDALSAFVEFIWRGQHRVFGSLVSRPYKGTGAGCTPFAMSWLKAAGIIPFVVEPSDALSVQEQTMGPVGAQNFWINLYRAAEIPWDHIGCDERVGASQPVPADYTVYDHLFYEEETLHLLGAIPGLAEKIKEDQGVVVATLFAFGALSPLRNLIIAGQRKDPQDLGSYAWADKGHGFSAFFWDNARFSDWIKYLWTTGHQESKIKLVKEGRFRGIEVDAMDIPRQSEPLFAEAERVERLRQRAQPDIARLTSCRSIFELGLQ